MEGRRRVTLYEQMSATADSSRHSLAGLTLDDVLSNQKRTAAPSQQIARSRTLLDIIREDESNKKDRGSWKAFKDKLRLNRAGSAWTSSIHIPTSDIPIPIPFQNSTSRTLAQFSHRNSVRFQAHSNSDVSTQYMAHQAEDIHPTADSTRLGSPVDAPYTGDSFENAATMLRPQLSRRNSTSAPSHAEPFRRVRVVTFRDSFDANDDGSDDDKNSEVGRALSAREAVAAQEASEMEAAAAAAASEEEESSGGAGEEPVRMSLMDLLEETDRQMGFEGSTYTMSDDEAFEDDEEEEPEAAVEYNCCVCMVRHKGAAFIPCGHTFCRLCSRELLVSRGNCPLCNNFILEILDIF